MKKPIVRATTEPPSRCGPPTVWLKGCVEHHDFRDAMEILRAEARTGPLDGPPELIVIAQERPGAIDQAFVEKLRRKAPLAGIVAIVGSWCEGEPRTGLPPTGVVRLYWYEFPAWWRRQCERRARGLFPEWTLGGDFESAIANRDSDAPKRDAGLVVLSVADWETADVLAETLHEAGYATAWQPPGRSAVLRNVVAGAWDGGQLNEVEETSLAVFCKQLQCEAAPVVALLDFPRRDCYDRAMTVGAAAVLGKPWLNVDLLATLAEVIRRGRSKPQENRPARAA